MRKLAKWIFAAAALSAWTWLWFLPVAGFHHMFRCGLLEWAIWDLENGEPELRWSGVVLALSVLAWLLGVAAVAQLAKRQAAIGARDLPELEP